MKFLSYLAIKFGPSINSEQISLKTNKQTKMLFDYLNVTHLSNILVQLLTHIQWHVHTAVFFFFFNQKSKTKQKHSDRTVLFQSLELNDTDSTVGIYNAYLSTA